jgi:hypothetical protein
MVGGFDNCGVGNELCTSPGEEYHNPKGQINGKEKIFFCCKVYKTRMIRERIVRNSLKNFCNFSENN